MIRSTTNPLLKEIRRTQARKVPGRFVAEGEDLVRAAQSAGWTAVHLLRAGIEVDEGALAKVSGLASGTRVLGVFEERWAAPAGPLCVALWGVRDPGNVGTVLRAAHAFGAGCVVIGPGTADPFGPKAVRASMGAIFSVPVARTHEVAGLPGEAVALVAHEGELLAPTGHPTTIVVGAEREGLPDEVVAACARTMRIEIEGDSLNAAMAATIALYELSPSSRVDPA